MKRPIGEILLRPVVTEKASTLQYAGTDAEGGTEASPETVRRQYTFEVARDANKPEIARAVEELFEVRVVAVRTMKVRGKSRRVRTASGRRPDWKKAVVTLAEGEEIDIYEGV